MLTIDCRMWRHSGIGRYLRNVVPQIVAQLECSRIQVLAPRELLAGEPFLDDARVRLTEFAAPIYSTREQLAPWTGLYRNAGLLWIPHYNAPLAYRGRLVATVHDLAPIRMREALSNAVKRTYARLLIANTARRAEHLFTVSDFTARDLAEHLAVPHERVTVTPLGLDRHWATATTVPHREPDGVPYVLFVGNIKPNKNLSLLLSAVQRMPRERALRVVVAGKVEGFSTGDEVVRQQAAKMGDRVRLAGQVTDTELRALYRGAQALCLPSLFEGFGLPVLEAMALGCPVVCSDATSLPEVAGESALLFDPQAYGAADRLAELLQSVQDPAVANELRRRGLLQAQRFSFARCARDTAAQLQTMLTGEPL